MKTYCASAVFLLIHDWGWPLNAEADHGLSSQDHQPKTAFHFLHGRSFRLALLFLWSNPSKLFTICENKVHVSVESEHLADECTAVVDRDLHPPVDETQHLATLGFWRSLDVDTLISRVLNGRVDGRPCWRFGDFRK